MYLNLEDLLNVSYANKHLQLATYARKNATKTIRIDLFEDSRNGIIATGTTIVIENFKTILQMIRCSGHVVTNINLSVASAELHRKYNRVCSYITR